MYYKLIHDYCGGVSLYFSEDPRGRVLDIGTAIYPNGVRPKDGEIVRCGHCHKPARCVEEHLYEVTDPREMDHVRKILDIK